MTGAPEHRVASAIDALFAEPEAEEAPRLVREDCTAGGVHGTEPGIERIRLAVLKLSGGDIAMLVDAIALAQTDYRDALMAAGRPVWSDLRRQLQ